ncbi:MAG: hypothetical protein R2771_07890 [Saprospiraceae bacterium]
MDRFIEAINKVNEKFNKKAKTGNVDDDYFYVKADKKLISQL